VNGTAERRATLLQNMKKRMKNQPACWQKDKSFFNCFPNEKYERGFTFSGISDQSVEKICVKES